jgi:hypothetical protein
MRAGAGMDALDTDVRCTRKLRALRWQQYTTLFMGFVIRPLDSLVGMAGGITATAAAGAATAAAADVLVF